MRSISRLFLRVNPKEEEKRGTIHTTHHHFGAASEGTIKYGTVHKKPKGMRWLKEGDKVWFTQQANQQMGEDTDGFKPCIIFPQETGELWALTKPWAEQTILGIERDGKILSSPNYIAALPIEKKVTTSLAIEIKVLNEEEEIRATCIENKDVFKKGDTIHFQENTDYPSSVMQSKWLNRDGKRVLFLNRDHIFGFERKNKFYRSKNWIIVEPLDEGDTYQKTKSGIILKRTDLEEIKGDAKVVYTLSKELRKGMKVKNPKRGYFALKIRDKRFYAARVEDVWFKYLDYENKV